MIRFIVPDMTCGHCVSTITKALKAGDPQAKVAISIGEHLIEVESSLAAEEIAAAISEAGYTPQPA